MPGESWGVCVSDFEYYALEEALPSHRLGRTWSHARTGRCQNSLPRLKEASVEYGRYTAKSNDPRA